MSLPGKFEFLNQNKAVAGTLFTTCTPIYISLKLTSLAHANINDCAIHLVKRELVHL